MLKIQILGSGCQRCQTMYENALVAVQAFNDATVDKITDPEIFFKMKVYMTPALVINDEVVSMGKLLEPTEIESEIKKRSGEIT